jgi:hypothetical protein
MYDHEHSQPTQRHRYRYLFTAKHHGGDKSAAQWHFNLSRNDEFAVFNGADEMELSDDEGNLFGVLPDGDESLRLVGAFGEQVAEFPRPAEGSAWHGYPVWPLNEDAPPNRRNQKHRPAKEVFDKMVNGGLIMEWMRRRLMKGDHV